MERYLFQRVKYNARRGYGINCAKLVTELTENRGSRRPRKGWGEGINNPDEMAACLSIMPVTSVITDLVRKMNR